MQLNKSRLVKGLLVLIVGLAAREYAHFTYFTSEMAGLVVYSQEERPYVFRLLVPWLAWGLTRFGLSPEVALTLVIIGFAIGFLYALIYIFQSFRRS